MFKEFLTEYEDDIELPKPSLSNKTNVSLLDNTRSRVSLHRETDHNFHKVTNFVATEERDLFFFPDVPHLYQKVGHLVNYT